ncbi:SDR family NAD(P)-dependent oxidoreductase [Paraburkholderia pallida]|uniref:SDR family oxidoreductase n=1 Tax=Paraburkholderia pallida TaxID=2547399 RepID=A0A4P7D7H2_9BURK|nr:SDR family NAD(P)-dependent oxidoreductase [Paraburkholderia pallida]QBR02895.1 SDR family oxidoreductase [Paraburkholderia pallida]
MKLQNKVVLITGAARGQGAAEAKRFAAEGAKVVLADVLDAEGEQLSRRLEGRAIYLHLDVTSDESWEAAFAQIERIHGRCDVLVNNAGIYRPAPIAETTSKSAEAMFQVNQLGTLLGMKYAAESMKKTGGGVIVNISSIAGLRGFANAIAYSGTKWAVRGMTKVAAAELAQFGIRVNSVHPGFIATDMLKENTAEVNRIGAEAAPLKRHGTPEEVANLVAFLASEDSAFITGAEVAIDGGWAI